MPIDMSARPRRIMIPGNPPIDLWDLRHRYLIGVPGERPIPRRELSQINEIAIHHDASWFDAGDNDYNGTTFDEDIERMDADYRAANDRLNLNPRRQPYDLYASPNGRLYYVKDSRIIGAHVEGHNTRAMAVCGFGDFTSVWPSLVGLAVYGGGCAVIWRGLWRKVPITGHRYFPAQSTVCPGNVFRPGWEALVELVAQRFAGF